MDNNVFKNTKKVTFHHFHIGQQIVLLKLFLFREVCLASDCNLHIIKSITNIYTHVKVKSGGEKQG